MQSSESNSYVDSCQEVLRRGGFAARWLENRGLSDHTVRKYRLGYDEQRHAIVIPYLNALGEIRRIRYRNFDGTPKYVWESGGEKGVHLFHVKATRKPQLWITEGEFDAMILHQMGYPSVAVPGAKLFKSEWRYLFAYCQQLTVVFDADESGVSGAQRVAAILGPVVADYRNVRLPEGKDVSELYMQNRKMLEELIK